MAAPFTPWQTFVDDSTPAMDEDFLNGHQAATNDLWVAVARSGFYFCEDFVQAAHASVAVADEDMVGEFRVKTLTTATVTQSGITPDATNKVRGAIRLAATANSGGVVMRTGDAYIGSAADVRFSVRLSVITRANLSTNAGSSGICIGGAMNSANNFQVSAESDQANWLIRVGASGDTDSGVAIADGTFYRVDFVRESGLLTVSINGTVATGFNGAADSTAINGLMEIKATAHGASGAADLIDVDYVKCWADEV